MHIPRITYITHACPGLGAVKIAEERRYWRPWLSCRLLASEDWLDLGCRPARLGLGPAQSHPRLARRMQCNRSKNVQSALKSSTRVGGSRDVTGSPRGWNF